jgi:hypothetical protein
MSIDENNKDPLSLVKRQIIDWIEVEEDFFKLKTIFRSLIGADGDSIEMAQLHELMLEQEGKHKQIDRDLLIIKKGILAIGSAISVVSGLVGVQIGGELLNSFLRGIGL